MHAAGVPAEPCWIPRDYDDPNDPLGCGGNGTRSCGLVDPWDPTAGTVDLPQAEWGPATSDVVESLSGNEFVVESGFYWQDHAYDPTCAAQGEQYLDDHNGHDHDGLGYHYHVTSSFPYHVGPSFAGALPDTNTARCSAQPGDLPQNPGGPGGP